MRSSGVKGLYSRREMLGGLARWSVPTVVTITLGSRRLEAKASCPPCQRMTGGVCRACAMGQILNCQCEPCLGPPYCSAVGPVAPATPGSSGGALTQPYPRQQGIRAAPGGGQRGPTLAPYALPPDRRGVTGQPLFSDPFSLGRTGYGPRSPQSQGLYQRLRPDSVPQRRLP